MAALRLSPVFLSLLLLAAHFLRGENVLAIALLFGAMALLFVGRPWSARLVQVVLVLGAVEWLFTLSDLVARRMEMGQPYARMVAIIGSVALLTGLSAFVFRSDVLRARYHLDSSPSAEQ